MMTPQGLITILVLSMVDAASGWSHESVGPSPRTSSIYTGHASTHDQIQGEHSPEAEDTLLNRRSFLAVAVASSSSFLITSHPEVALASTTLSQDAALAQWKASVVTIDNLLDHWDNVYPGGGSQKEIGISGDAIRKELGTANFGEDVSPLFQIDKAFKVLRENDEVDLVEFTERSEEFAEALAAADSMAYSANFAGGSGNPSSNKPKVFIEKARKEVEGLQMIAKSLSALLL